MNLRDLNLPAFLPGEAPTVSDGGLGHYTPDGERINGPDELTTWASLRNQWRANMLRDDVGSVQVSTVYLGLDHQWSAGGPILTWETMTFGGDEDTDECQWRYATRAAAESGHRRVVEELRKGPQ